MLLETVARFYKKRNTGQSFDLFTHWPVFLFLLFCPLAASAGTNNPLSIHLTQFLFFWMIVFLLIIEMVSCRDGLLRMIRPVFVLILVGMVCSQFLYGFIRSPYRLNHGLDKQKFSWKTGTRSGSVLLDETTYQFASHISMILKSHGYERGNFTAISLYSYPGLVYLSGANSPGAAWYFSDGYKGNEEANCYMISKTKLTDLKRTVIFYDSDKPVSTLFSECLKSKGILFPENYFCADSVLFPDSSGYLKIYLPD
jgi:hypothetical protein